MPISSWSRTPTAAEAESDPNSLTHSEEVHVEETAQIGGRQEAAQRAGGQEAAQRGGRQEVAQKGRRQDAAQIGGEHEAWNVDQSSGRGVMEAKQRLVSRAKRRSSSAAARRSATPDSSSIVGYEAGPYKFSTCSPSTLGYRHEQTLQPYTVTYSTVAGSTTGAELKITTTANTCTVLTPTTATCNGVTINRISTCEDSENAGQSVCRVSKGVRRLKFSCQNSLDDDNSLALANWKLFWRR
jgi:hypothetical protein